MNFPYLGGGRISAIFFVLEADRPGTCAKYSHRMWHHFPPYGGLNSEDFHFLTFGEFPDQLPSPNLSINI